MEKRMLGPAEIAQFTIAAGVKKANLPALKMVLLGIFAGMFIGFGAHADIVVIQTLGKIDIGLAKLLGAAVFPVGIMLVCMAGSELFTGNNLLTLALFDKKITLKGLLKNWSLVYLGNFIGSVLLAYFISETGLYGSEAMASKAIGIATAKVGLSLTNVFLRAVFCNILVVLAIWFSFAAKDVISKIFALWFPIMLFVLSGFEHSVANMFFIPLGKFLGASMTWSEIWVNNLIPVTIGNIVGGAIIVPVVYYICYVKDAK